MRKHHFVTLLFALAMLCLNAQVPEVVIDVQPPTIEAGGAGVVDVHFALPEHYHIQKQEEYLFVNIEAPEGVVFEPAVYPEAEKDDWGFEMYYVDFSLTRAFTVSPDAAPGQHELKFVVGWQMCDETTCLPPEEIEMTAMLEVTGGSGLGGFSAAEIIKYLLMAFIGGVILNIMPCVLPVLSIKAMHLVGQAQHDRKEIMKGSLSYTAGILVSFIVMAAVVITLKFAGESVGWGFQMQNVTFNIILASIIFVFSLSLFDVFIISPPGMSMAAKASNKKGHAGSFFSGVFAVLLATPCTAPLLAPALGVAFKLPALFILPFFLLIGLGLALPFILLAFWPKIIQKLPKPGEWMNVFREAMAFLLLGAAVWVLRVLPLQVGVANFERIIWFMLVLAFASWVYGRFAKPHHSKAQQWIALLAALAIVAGSASLLLRFEEYEEPVVVLEGEVTEESLEQLLAANWSPFSPELVYELRENNVPVFIDFGAEWCATCKTFEKTILETEEIETAFREHGVVTLKADYTRKSPIITEWLQMFGRSGVPVYVLYFPGEEEPYIFPDAMSKGEVHKALERLE